MAGETKSRPILETSIEKNLREFSLSLSFEAKKAVWEFWALPAAGRV